MVALKRAVLFYRASFFKTSRDRWTSSNQLAGNGFVAAFGSDSAVAAGSAAAYYGAADSVAAGSVVAYAAGAREDGAHVVPVLLRFSAPDGWFLFLLE